MMKMRTGSLILQLKEGESAEVLVRFAPYASSSGLAVGAGDGGRREGSEFVYVAFGCEELGGLRHRMPMTPTSDFGKSLAVFGM